MSSTTTINEFKDILNAEVYIDLDKLRGLSRHGIPKEVRGEVWKYLLEVNPADRSQELTSTRAKYQEYSAIDKETFEMIRIRGEANRYQNNKISNINKSHSINSNINSSSKIASNNINNNNNNKIINGNHLDSNIVIDSDNIITSDISNDNDNGNNINNGYTSIFENVIGAYLNYNGEIEYYPALIHLCGPFVYCIRNEAEVYYCFGRLMETLDEYNSIHNINERIAGFMTLFRSIIPDLCNYFEEEEVDINVWASSWLQYLLARELQFDNLLRLWDTYFSIDDPIEFHPYVCLAVLKHNKEYLEELEQSEIRTLLLRLPQMDMEQIINQAFNIRHEILEKEISDSL